MHSSQFCLVFFSAKTSCRSRVSKAWPASLWREKGILIQILRAPCITIFVLFFSLEFRSSEQSVTWFILTKKKCFQFCAFFPAKTSRRVDLGIRAWPASFWREKKWIRIFKFKFCAGLAYLTIASPMYNFPVWSAAIPLNILEMRMGIRFSRPPLIDIPRPWPVMVLTILTGRTPSGGGPPLPCWSFSVKVCWKYRNFIKLEKEYTLKLVS